MKLTPLGVARTQISMGFCFPAPTVKLPGFPPVLECYLKRWHLVVSEDNTISMNQQRGVRSIRRKPGRFGPLEFGTHNCDNGLLSKVCIFSDAQGHSMWDPGQRVFIG